jgi:phytoene synthase
LYGFTRYTDEIVDAPNGQSPARRAERLHAWADRFAAALAGAPTDDPVLPAVVHTITLFDLDRADFAAFLRLMEMDLTVSTYDTYDDLLVYMEGSAAAIGSMMLPILGARERAVAREPARELGRAFQLTNFIRDVAEDLARGRIYLPLKDLVEFGLTPEDLYEGVVTRQLRELVAFESGGPAVTTSARPRAYRCWLRARRRASGPRTASTVRSWTRSSGPGTTCSRAGPRFPVGVGSPWRRPACARLPGGRCDE